jgi:hypothetical protein
MALKIISGLLCPSRGCRSEGSASIRFSDGKIIPGSEAKFSEVTVVGTGVFAGEPCKQVSLRHVIFIDSDRGNILPMFNASEDTFFDLSDDLVLENGVPIGLKISWQAGPKTTGKKRKSEILEISVMIIGETK